MKKIVRIARTSLIIIIVFAVVLTAVSGLIYSFTKVSVEKEGVIEWVERVNPKPINPKIFKVDAIIEALFVARGKMNYKDVEVVIVERTFFDWIAGVSVQNRIFILKGYESLLPHEYIHTLQWRRYGTVGFIIRYFGMMPWLFLSGSDAYWNNVLEKEAREREPDL